MATRRKVGKQPKVKKQRNGKAKPRRREPVDDDLELAEELLRPPSAKERAGIDAELKKFRKFLEAREGIPLPKPIGAKKLREMAIREGLDPKGTEFSRGIIDMREE
jgi:hypothetical protein